MANALQIAARPGCARAGLEVRITAQMCLEEEEEQEGGGEGHGSVAAPMQIDARQRKASQSYQ